MTGRQLGQIMEGMGYDSQPKIARALGRSQGTVCELLVKRTVPRAVEAHVNTLVELAKLKRAACRCHEPAICPVHTADAPE